MRAQVWSRLRNCFVSCKRGSLGFPPFRWLPFPPGGFGTGSIPFRKGVTLTQNAPQYPFGLPHTKVSRCATYFRRPFSKKNKGPAWWVERGGWQTGRGKVIAQAIFRAPKRGGSEGGRWVFVGRQASKQPPPQPNPASPARVALRPYRRPCFAFLFSLSLSSFFLMRPFVCSFLSFLFFSEFRTALKAGGGKGGDGGNGRGY